MLSAVAAPHPAAAAQCGLPDAAPLWIEYSEGSVTFRRQVFGRPGIIVASSGTVVPTGLRQAGAQTVYWHMRLSAIAGTTLDPADPAKVDAAASRLVDLAIASTGCQTPLIGLNELLGARTTTPWSTNNAQYRANVLQALRVMAARGARPFLLVSAPPYTGGEAGDWWRAVAQVADILPEVYFNAARLARLGPVVASRRIRVAFRQAILDYTELGIPVTRLGLVLGFQSGPGTGGREGLQPSSAWFEVVKLQALAAKQVASELGLASVWSWGWGTFNTTGADPDKAAAACVYLWARDPDLCDGPGAAGPDFDDDLAEGQINLAPGVVCTLDDLPITTADVGKIASLTGDSNVALSILFARRVESAAVDIDPARVLAAERRLIVDRFGGSRAAYVSALFEARANVPLARDAIADQLRRFDLEQMLTVDAPPGSDIRAFYQSYPNVLARLVKVAPAPSWLGGRTRGYVLAPVAPERLFDLPTAETSTLETERGSYTVTALTDPLPIGALPFIVARRAISAALQSFARDAAFDAWKMARENGALSRILCVRDALPTVASVELASFVPFLQLAPS
jgi:hypothetical protein